MRTIIKYTKYLINYLASFSIDFWDFLFRDVRSRIGGPKYYKESKLYPGYLKQGNMLEAVKWLAQKYCRGKGVDIGSGKWPLPGARAIENNAEENAYHISEQDEALDFIFSSHLLEHLSKWEEALREWHRTLKIGGIIFLYLPHPACVMWEPGVNAQHLWTPNPQSVSNFLSGDLGMKIKEITYLPDGYLSFLIVAEK